MADYEQEGMYSITVDKEKNRMHLLFFGQWSVPEDVPKYTDHVAKATSLMKKGFHILAEIRDKKPPSLKVTGIHKKGQQIMKKAGVNKTAVIIAKGRKGQFLQKMTLNVVGRLSGMTIKTFTSVEEGEAWLDEKKENE